MVETKRVFLSPDERYEVWLVKAAERPELLLLLSHDDDDEPSGVLQDGCDVTGWRRHRLVTIRSSAVASCLRIGQGSPLLRRERQLPLLSCRNNNSDWENLKASLLQPCHNNMSPGMVHYDDCREVHPWFERQNVPAVIMGCCESWNMHALSYESLLRNYGHLQWRFSDSHGETLTLQTYHRYLHSLEGQCDDAPLGIYDSQFDDDDRRALLDCYQVPSCFASDLFHGVEQRPPYRWILIGPPRSGTGLHIDPVGTHAWVTLVQGLKRWVLYPPHADDIKLHDPQIPSSIWFRDHYNPQVDNNCVEYLQRPGETVYVPAGWPHAVLNLEFSVALTHNFASIYPNVNGLLSAIQKEEPQLYQNLRDVLERRSLVVTAG